MTKHLIPEEYLLEYAAGVLPEGAARLIAAHLTFSPASRAVMRDADRLGGALLEMDQAFEPLNSGIAIAPWDMPYTGQVVGSQSLPQADADVPVPLRPLIGNRLSDIKWRTFWPGMQTVKISCPEDTADISLLRLKPGTGMPVHTHGGDELTLVLQGSYTDETGQYGVGDVSVCNSSLTHRPIADSGQHCICFTVVDAPLRFKGIMARIASRLLLT
jgi:putative transcriptional regulator